MTRFVCLLFSIFTYCFSARAAKPCQNATTGTTRSMYFSGGTADLVLHGHGYRNLTGKSAVQCGKLCLSDARCFSINFSEKDKLCEFNGATASQYPRQLTERAGGHYYGPEEPDAIQQLQSSQPGEEAACVSFNTNGYHYNYKFAALPKSADGGVRFEFSARATNDVHLSLVERNEDSAVMYEIVVGAWSDTKSVIRRSKQGSNLRLVAGEASSWLDGDTDKGFWVSAVPATNQGNLTLTISIGKGSEIDAFMTLEDHQPITVNYLGFSLWEGVKGSFTFCGLALRE